MQLAGEIVGINGLIQSGEIRAAENSLVELMKRISAELGDTATQLKDRVRFGGLAQVELQIDIAQKQDPDNVAVKLLRLYMHCVKANQNSMRQIDVLERSKRVAINAIRSRNLLCVNINVPISTCNYRCEYCFLNHDPKPDLSKIEKVGEIIEKLGSIPRPLGITVTPAGEILAVPKMWPFLGQAARLANAAWVETWSNLSRDPEILFDHIDPSKLCLIATYHPTEFKNFNRDNEAFFSRLSRAKEAAQDVSVNFVVYEKNIPYIPDLRRRLSDLDIHLTANPQNNKTNGYGQPIKPLDDIEKAIARELASNEFIDFFYIKNKKADVRCTAGRDLIDIRTNGDVSRCEHVAPDLTSGEFMGNILDGSAVIDIASRFCGYGGCACKSTLGYIEDCVVKFKRIGTQHKYHRRPENEVGTHSYDPVDLPGLNVRC